MEFMICKCTKNPQLILQERLSYQYLPERDVLRVKRFLSILSINECTNAIQDKLEYKTQQTLITFRYKNKRFEIFLSRLYSWI